MLPLKPRRLQLIFTRHARAVTAGDRGSTIGRTTGNLIDTHLSLERIGQADNHEPMMQQADMETENRGFLAAMLGCGACKDTANFAHQRTFGPELSGSIQKLAHLAAHVAKTGGGAEN